LKWCAELNLHSVYNILYGFPGETAADYEDYVRMFGLVGHLQPPVCLGPVLFERFSPYHFDQGRFGLSLKAAEEYALLYPSARVSLERIAYYFQSTNGNGNGHTFAVTGIAPPDYMAPILAAYDRWKRQWKNVFCYYNKGPGYIVINDNRPLAGMSQEFNTKKRRFHLKDPVATIYTFCDQQHSLPAILKMVREKFGETVAEGKIEGWLNRLVARGLMYQEDNRYLSLAVRSKWLAPMKITTGAE
jgi:hypothetical protein